VGLGIEHGLTDFANEISRIDKPENYTCKSIWLSSIVVDWDVMQTGHAQ
jgi:hypothetical protein